MASEPSNRDIANGWISFMLGELFEAWPRRFDFNALDVARKTSLAPRSEDEKDELFDDTIDWLRSEGYIRTSTQVAPEGHAFGVALTEKGYAILGKTPESLGKPLGLRLKEAVGEGGTTAGREVIAKLVGTIVSVATGM